MKRATQLVVVFLASILLSAGKAWQPPTRTAEWSLREYRVNCPEDIMCEGDIYPTAGEVALYGPTIDPHHHLFFISIYDYHNLQKPLATMSAHGGIIHWKRPLIVESFLRCSPDGRSLLAYDKEGLLHLFDLENRPPREVRTIDLGMSLERPNFQPVDMEWSPGGKRIMVLFSFYIFHEGVVRVYDAATGHMQWENSFDGVQMAHGAWSPDGRRLAVTVLSGQKDSAYPLRDVPNLVILDGDSGQALLGIKTGDTAGPVCFAPDNAVLTAPFHFHPQSRDMFQPGNVKVWDATTGRLMRQIASRGRDIHDDLELSQDGNTLLAYVGKENSGFSFRAMEGVEQLIDERFQLFDYQTGDLIATSPDLMKSRFDYHPPSFRLGPHGDRVLAYWPNSGYPASVFELSPPREP